MRFLFWLHAPGRRRNPQINFLGPCGLNSELISRFGKRISARLEQTGGSESQAQSVRWHSFHCARACLHVCARL